MGKIKRLIRSDFQDNFKDHELVCHCGCGTLNVHPVAMNALQDVRFIYGDRIRVHSACRCPAYNKDVGGASKSYHIATKDIPSMAFDISPWSPENSLWFLAVCCTEVEDVLDGCIIIYPYNKTPFIHIDVRTEGQFLAIVDKNGNKVPYDEDDFLAYIDKMEIEERK